MDIEKANANKEHILTVPATYIIGKDGRIKTMHFEEDYKQRMSVKDIVNALKS